MLRIIKERLHQKYRTLDYPNRQPTLSPRYLGRPELAQVSCGSCRACYAACPAGALLPTAGAARAYSGVSVASYQNQISVQAASREGIAGIGPCALTLARAEGLGAHANAVALRLGVAP